MSRFARQNGVQFRVWSPPESPARIEYSTALLRQVQLEAGRADAAGELFGMRIDGGYRVAAARINAREHDPLLAGLDLIGIFASRLRGEIFLTESDLVRLENHSVALVMAGGAAGFFVREADGSMQAIHSYQEFAAPTPPPKPGALPVVFAGLACLLLLMLAFLVPHRTAPIMLSVHAGENGQLRIAWNPTGAGSLEIHDGGDRTAISTSPDMTGATYLPHTSDVRIELRRHDGSHEQARFIGKNRSLAAKQVDDLDAELSALRKVIEIRRSRVSELEQHIRSLSR